MAASWGRRLAGGEAPARRCNLERFLEATTPVVTPSCSSKEGIKGWSQSDADDSLPFFTLGDLWDAFRECSAYGTAVPLVLNSCSDDVVQYYVPYLSAIQLYGGFRRHVGPSRMGAEESDSDVELETSSSANTSSAQETSESSSGSEASSDEGESGRRGHEQLLFEFLESELPYQREPLADKAYLQPRETVSRAADAQELRSLASQLDLRCMVPDLRDPGGTNTARPGRLLPHLPLPLHAVRRRRQAGPQTDGPRGGDVAPDVRDGVVQAQGRGVDAGVARPAAGGVPRAGRRRLDQAPPSGPPGPPVLRRPARAEQEVVIGAVESWRSTNC